MGSIEYLPLYPCESENSLNHNLSYSMECIVARGFVGSRIFAIVSMQIKKFVKSTAVKKKASVD